MKIYGIPCRVKSPTVRRAIRIVLRQIRKRAPKDFERIRSLVCGFVPQPEREVKRGMPGYWKQRPPSALTELRRKGRTIRESDLRSLENKFDWPGVIRIAESCPDRPLAVVAHELGHACTREKDFTPREEAAYGDGEWASEMCADLYAYKWGFGREIARSRKYRSVAHHGYGPGKIFTYQPGGDTVYRCRVTRAFYIRMIQWETPEGKIIETVPDRIRELHTARVKPSNIAEQVGWHMSSVRHIVKQLGGD